MSVKELKELLNELTPDADDMPVLVPDHTADFGWSECDDVDLVQDRYMGWKREVVRLLPMG